MKNRRSLTARAFLAVILFIGFYVLALVIIGILLYIPYFQIVSLDRISGRLTLFCIIGAGIILWSIIPRRDRFTRPGPLLIHKRYPRFFSKIDEIASISKQDIPQEVYFIPEANAWVSSRGGFMGIGSRRVLAIGLPLLRILTTDQLLAILAHEFGHYYGGDVKLGPWIYKTRTALYRTIKGLQRHSSVLQMPFVFYARTFLKATSTVSRYQEYEADKLAARIYGKKNMMDALILLKKGAFVFNSYWINEIAPVLSKGFCPPLSEGFSTYLKAEYIKEFMVSNYEENMDANEVDPYASHPSLADRLETLNKMQEKEFPPDNSLALSLFNANEEKIDEEMKSWLLESEKTSLSPISWQEVAQKVWPKIWEERAATYYCNMLRRVVPLDFPKLIQKETSMESDSEQGKEALIIRFGTILIDGLIKQGWIIDMHPGSDVILKKGNLEFRPFQTITQLVNSELHSGAWINECQRLGIESISIGPN